jgi:anion-transporting  ArsA/GET3 family ATPase
VRVSENPVEHLLDSRLVMVTGKGGTGKTTYAAALAVLGAVRGKRVIVVELDNQRPSLTAVFHKEPRFQPAPVRVNLDLANLAWDGALHAYIESVVPSRRVTNLILNNPVVGRFLDFTPGSREMVILSAVGALVDKYDLVVVDMPASGHAFSLLDITRSAMGLFRSGPVRTRATELKAMISDPRTQVVLVALPEEMVVNETLETIARMRSFQMLHSTPTVFLNRATLPSLTELERDLLARLSGSTGLSPIEREFVVAGSWEDGLEQATAAAERVLTEQLGVPPILVPPSAPGGVPRDTVEAVAVHLGRSVGATRREIAWT